MHQTYTLIESDYVLLSQPSLIKKYGRLKAQFLCQLHYWEQKGQGVVHQGRRWVFNTADQWAEQLHISAGHFKRIIKDLANEGVLFIDKLSPHKSIRTNYYAINHEALAELIENRGPSHRNILLPSSDPNDAFLYQKQTNKDILYKSDDVEPKLSKNLSKEKNQVTTQTDTTQSHLPNKLIDIWNTEVTSLKGKKPDVLSKTIARHLVAMYQKKCASNLDAWRNYCKLIASSSYLMGKNFSLTLSWALKFTIADRILKGELGVNLNNITAREQKQTKADIYNQACNHIDGVGEPEACKQVRHSILKAVGPLQYNAWFTKVDILDDGKTLKAHNKFIEDAINSRFGSILHKSCLHQHG